MEKFSIGVIIYTYNRVDDARIQMEIIRKLWAASQLFAKIVIVHSYNGKKDWYEKYLEDELVVSKNTTHFAGAAELMEKGMNVIKKKYRNLDYVFCAAADTWCLDVSYIEKLISNMYQEKRVLSTSVWGDEKNNSLWEKGVALDFFCCDARWFSENNVFPLKYDEFNKKYSEIITYLHRPEILLERLFLSRFIQAVKRRYAIPSEAFVRKLVERLILRMKEREPIHRFGVDTGGLQRVMFQEDINLACQHNPQEKKVVLQGLNLSTGKYGQKLLESNDLSYYNNGLLQNEFDIDGEFLSYEGKDSPFGHSY